MRLLRVDAYMGVGIGVKRFTPLGVTVQASTASKSFAAGGLEWTLHFEKVPSAASSSI